MFDILVIDDKEENLDELSETFEHAFNDNVKTHTASYGIEGINIFREKENINLIIIDIENKMEADSLEYAECGSEIADMIKKDPKYHQTEPPIKFISAHGNLIENYERYKITNPDNVYNKEEDGFNRLVNYVRESLEDPLYRISYSVRKDFYKEIAFLKEAINPDCASEIISVISEVRFGKIDPKPQFKILRERFEDLINELSNIDKFKPPKEFKSGLKKITRKIIIRGNLTPPAYLDYLDQKKLILNGQAWGYKNLWATASAVSHRGMDKVIRKFTQNILNSFIYLLMDLVQLVKTNHPEYK